MSHDRRDFLKTLTSTMLGSAVASIAAEPASFAQATRIAEPRAPLNVILMICDDLGYGDLGCYGSAIPTPNLDRLAAQGTRCTHYNSAHPICSASRAALLTGRYAPRSHTAGALFPHQKGVSLDEQTLANLFHDQGYRTHAIGKWHLGDLPGYFPTDRGFDTFYGVPYSDDMQPLPLLRGTSALEADTDRDELTPRYTEEALKMLATQPEKPFFLYIAYSYPHDPARGSKAFHGRSAFGDYGDAVEEIDWSVGRLMDALERSGKAKDTVVIFTSDHGPWFQGSHGLTRGRKGSTFEGGVRVPFLIRWPGRVPAATVCNEWLGHLNVLPTLSSWCGLAQPKLPLDGFDMSATLLQRQPSPAKPVLYFSPVGGRDDIHAIRSGGWKLRVAQSDGEIYINDYTAGRQNFMLPKPELYHLDKDPMESFDMAKSNPQVVQHMMEDLTRELESFPAETRAGYAQLQKKIASTITPPGAAPRNPQGPLPDWAWEPPDRRPS